MGLIVSRRLAGGDGPLRGNSASRSAGRRAGGFTRPAAPKHPIFRGPEAHSATIRASDAHGNRILAGNRPGHPTRRRRAVSPGFRRRRRPICAPAGLPVARVSSRAARRPGAARSRRRPPSRRRASSGTARAPRPPRFPSAPGDSRRSPAAPPRESPRCSHASACRCRPAGPGGTRPKDRTSPIRGHGGMVPVEVGVRLPGGTKRSTRSAGSPRFCCGRCSSRRCRSGAQTRSAAGDPARDAHCGVPSAVGAPAVRALRQDNLQLD